LGLCDGHAAIKPKKGEMKVKTSCGPKNILISNVAIALLDVARVSFSHAGELVLIDPKLECSIHTYEGGTDWKHTVYVDIVLSKMQYRVGDFPAPNPKDAGGTVVDHKASVLAGPTLALESAKLVPSAIGGASVDVTRQGDGKYFLVNKGNLYTCVSH
jgi:hypothetical protein